MSRGCLSFLPKTAAALSFTLLILLSAGPAASFDLGVRLGYGHSPDGETSEPSAGIYTRLDIPGPVNLELAGDYWKEELPGGTRSVTNLPLQATALLYFFPFPFIKPYLLGGAGVFLVHLTGEGGLEENDQLFCLQGGAGLDVPLAGMAGLTADFRYYASEEMTVKRGAGPEETYQPGGWRLFAGFHLRF